jgi:GntR family transcriptional regulator, transcriptional repressor for pyruvate dehydrogenase complex
MTDRRAGSRGPRPGAPPPSPAQGVLAPMTVRTTGERIAERFVTAIALGQFVPGQRLPTERELATMLGVSRATVREAIARLAESGYVTVRRGRAGGTFVVAGWGPESAEMIRRTLSPEWLELEQLLDFRQVIEQQIARTAALRRSEADVKAIRGALRDYEQAGEDRDSSRMADLALHRAIADATHNPHLLNLSLSIRHDISFGFEAEPYSPEVRGRALHQHPRLAQAVIDGHPVRAAELAADHFSLTESMLRELHARVMLRSGPPQAGQPQAGLPEAGLPEDGQPEDGQPQAGQPQE